MIISMRATLYDTIKGRREEFEESVALAVQSALTALGDRVFELDWACAAAKEELKQAA